MAQLTRGELRKIDQRPIDPLKRTESEQSVEESMDPPSFTRKILREELRISENELNKYQKILNEKALKITQKLTSKEDDEGLKLEEIKQASPSKLAIIDNEEEDKEEEAEGGAANADEAEAGSDD